MPARKLTSARLPSITPAGAGVATSRPLSRIAALSLLFFDGRIPISYFYLVVLTLRRVSIRGSLRFCLRRCSCVRLRFNLFLSLDLLARPLLFLSLRLRSCLGRRLRRLLLTPTLRFSTGSYLGLDGRVGA
jgi:hypothetical protein